MISLQNTPLLEIDFIKTMGLHVKEGDSIGYFGTGLKYAISVFLREGVDFELYLGTNKYEFYTETKVLRGKPFEYCYMRGPHDTVELNFCTDLGRNWDIWQAYREIHSNCLDEQGDIVATELAPKEGHTTFIFKNIDELIDISMVFLKWQEKEPLYKNDEIEIYEGESEYLYYRGIRAKNLEVPAKYTYNVLKHCDLTEDRLLCYDFQIKRAINNAVVELAYDDSDIMENIITSGLDWFEGQLNMDFNTDHTPSPKFIERVEDIKKKSTTNVACTVLNYLHSYEPIKEPTPQERKRKFLISVQDLCSEYGVEFFMHSIGNGNVVELTEGILEVSDEEEDS